MLKLYILIIFTPFIATIAQQIFINEVMTKNIDTFFDHQNNTPDWIELYNNDSLSYNLSDHFITDNIEKLDKWKFPNIEITSDEYLLLLASGRDKKHIVKKWETIVDLNQAWRYTIGSSSIPAEWINPDFEDNHWSLGLPGFGFGDGDDRTVIQNTNSVYLRTKISIDDLSTISSAVLHLDYDDGFAAYLNGQEIARNNLGSPGTFTPYYTLADENHEAVIYTGGSPEYFLVKNIDELLVQGDNYLCIQVHNVSANSSDLSAIPFFSVGRIEDSDYAYDPPEFLNFPSLYLQTNFSLSSAGENLYLVNPELAIIDSVVIPGLSGGISYGRDQLNIIDFKYFINPTPGEQNNDQGFSNILDPPSVSVKSGSYNSEIKIELTTQDDSEIYYSLDGSVPTNRTIKYENEITLQESKVLRAISYKAGSIPSDDIKETYFINENSDLPLVSVITDPKNLWDHYEGIYVLGPNAESENPNFGANFWQDWEKEGFIQLFEDNTGLSYESNAGLKIFGTWSRAHAQKSLSIHARKKYGNGSFNYKFFPDSEHTNYESLVLRNSGNDWYFTMFRDAMMQKLVKNLDIDSQNYRPSIVFLNGNYWGIHNIREKINEDYLSLHHDIPADEIDLLENNGDVLEGSNQHYMEMISFIEENDLAVHSNYDSVKKMMDIENFINYTTSQIYYDNSDWPGNNVKFWRHQSSDSKWRWILFDTDFGFGIYQTDAYRNNTLSFALEVNGPAWPNPPWSTFLLRNLLKNYHFKNRFINRYADLSNTVFRSSHVISVIDSLQRNLSNEIRRHIEKWSAFSFNGWVYSTGVLKNFGMNRNAYLKLHYINEFSLDGLYQLTINIDSQGSGSIQVNSILVDDRRWQGDYFIGNEIKLIAHEKPGYKFVKWDEIDSYNDTLYLNPDSNTELTAVFEEEDFTSTIVINEINYNSAPTGDSEDWIELYNSTDEEIDLSNWILKDSQDSSSFQFPDGIKIPSNQFLIVCRDSSAFKSVYTSDIYLIGDFDFALSNGGDDVRLFNEQGELIDEVKYDDESPWPLEADGTGKTLSLKNPFFNNALPESWSASNDSLGTPGDINDNFITNVKTVDSEQIDFHLSQNYPNPFNPETTIRYSVPSRNSINDGESKVTLEVYDLLGRKVCTLVNTKKSAGNYSVIWNASDFSSGIYFYRLKINSFQKTMKAVLIK
jgi:hypothetical protein